MSDKNKNSGDEYQFPADEYVAAEEEIQPNYDAFSINESAGSTNATQKESPSVEPPVHKKSIFERFSMLQNKRIWVVIGVVVVVFIGFKILSPSHSVQVIKPEQTPQQVAASQQQVQQNTLMSEMDHLSKNASNSQNMVNQLQNQVSSLKDTLSQSNESNKAMREAIIVLAQQVENLSIQMKKVTSNPKQLNKMPPSPEIVFHLRAIIPGRAWVEGSDGETNTVTVGSVLQDYGTVSGINVDTSTITTSSGKNITYNSDGN